LNASMNRHFIFNALNSIQFYINTQDKRSANKYLSSFAKLIRKNLDSSTENNNLVPLDEELERLKLYLELEKMRFDDKFTYEIENDELFTDDYLVPAMLLQPFVENSILHGILPSDKKGKITISILDFPNHIEIRIKDNGVGIKQSLQNKSITTDAHKSKGMEISSKRIDLLRKLYDKNFELIGPYQTTDENGLISGTTVLIKIPKENM
ncbi:MAG TPA: histidine kinase, partial [Crocinitomicaceae bacterium]|nr:histidine kinase [Crocinitomicaceae bacterium]